MTEEQQEIVRRPLLYLDIDGVLLRSKPGEGSFSAFELAPGATEFLIWAIVHFDCRWLSTRCRHANAESALRAFRLAGGVSPELHEILMTIVATPWVRIRPTASISIRADFYWLDDAADDDERRILAECGREDRLIELSVERDPHALAQAMATLAISTARQRTKSNRWHPMLNVSFGWQADRPHRASADHSRADLYRRYCAGDAATTIPQNVTSLIPWKPRNCHGTLSRCSSRRQAASLNF